MEYIEKRVDEVTGQVWWGCNWCSALHEDEALMRAHAKQHDIGPDLNDQELADLMAEMGEEKKG